MEYDIKTRLGSCNRLGFKVAVKHGYLGFSDLTRAGAFIYRVRRVALESCTYGGCHRPIVIHDGDHLHNSGLPENLPILGWW